MNIINRTGLLAALFTSAFALHLHAQGTAFTYQGQLNEGDGVASGNYDLTFALFDDPSAGSQAGTTQTNLNVAVSNGVFTTSVDFGAGIFSGTPYWLAIGARSNGVAVDFSLLTPRQPVSPTPYALYAAGAALADNSVTSAKIVDGTVTAADLGANSVNTGEITDGQVMTADLANDAVTSGKILDGTVTSADIANGTITTSDLSLASVDGRYVLKAGDTMTGNLSTPNLTVPGVINNSSIAGISSMGITSPANIDLTIDRNNNGGVLGFFEVLNGAGGLAFQVSETGVARTYSDHLVSGRLGVGTLSPTDTLHVFDAGNAGDIMVENQFPFITLKQSGSNNNAGFLFSDTNGYSGWLYYRGSDQALTMGSTTSGGTPNTLVLQRDGNAGIGTATAFAKLTVNGTIGFESPGVPAAYIYESGAANVVKPLFVHSPSFPTWGLFYDDTTDEFVIGSTTTNDPALVVSAGGDWVAINTSTRATGYELSVDGQIACEEILVQDSGSWPDYVFEENYPLKPLNEVETHIKERKHLPGIPTAKELAVTGISVGDMQKRMMEKIEELTLYMIEQDKRLAAQEKTIGHLQSKLQEIQP